MDGFGEPVCKPGPASQPDAGLVPPVDPAPDAGARKPHGGQRKRHGRFTQPLTVPERALSKDAEAQARQLRRKHRALYTADARWFRRIVRAVRETLVVAFPERHFAGAYWESGPEADGPRV